MSKLDETLADRGKKYGNYNQMAECICDLQQMILCHQTGTLSSSQRHALDMIMVKIGRIITGDSNYDDNWRDIAGYATKALESLPPKDFLGPEGGE